MNIFDPFDYSWENISDKVRTIISQDIETIDRRAAYRFILSVIDLTTLNGDDRTETIDKLCQKAISFENFDKDINNVAAVCVYPPFVAQAKHLLQGTNIRVAAVSGCFPSGQSPLFAKLSEVTYAVEEGADEIDAVISRGKFLEGKYEEVSGEITAIKKACGKAHLKVILETGELRTTENIRKASEIAILSGADFIKTSTGKISPAATLEAAWIMMTTIKEYYEKTEKKIGFKPAGGISEPDEALNYYILLKHILGEAWMNNELFRIGASRLADKLYTNY
ncbi:MAG: deoxyribose-phosphate aldolase [Bacteroidales bacterium]|jgi:deoxyribose-phosphate aldolase|nr:deoxyribose-phosphate aldolase [Bacteroidales bacterium]